MGWSRESRTYKWAGDLAIHADVYRDPNGRERPVVVFIHGGALINGHREWIPDWIVDSSRENGFVLVSIDYRLAPETKLPELIDDVVDAFGWLREEGAELFGADPSRVGVLGESAGGYLSLATGFLIDPRPGAIVSFYGYGDLIGDWYSTPSPHACHRLLRPSPDEAYRQVSGPPISDDRDRAGDGHAFYQFCRQRGIWPSEVSGGWDPVRDAERFRDFMPLVNVAADYPPTMLVHGDRDTDVPVEQSTRMADELARHGVEHELLVLAGAEHGLEDGEPDEITGSYRAASGFLRDHLEPR